MESENTIKYSKNEILAIKSEENSFYLLKLSNDFREGDSELRGTSFIKSKCENKKIQFIKSRLSKTEPKNVIASVFAPQNPNINKTESKLFFLNEDNYNKILKAGDNKAFNLSLEQKDEAKEEIPKRKRGPKKKSAPKEKDENSKVDSGSEGDEEMNLGPYKKIKLTEKTSKNQKNPKKGGKGSKGPGKRGNQPQINDKIQIVSHSLQFESESSVIDNACCLHCTKTELSRCLLTSNTALLSQILDSLSFSVSSLFHNPNPSYFSNSPVFILFEKQNINLVDMALSLKEDFFNPIRSNNRMNSKRNRYQNRFNNNSVPLPPWGYTPNVHEARGGKEGNAAFWENTSSSSGDIIEKIIEKFDNIQIFESLRAKLKTFESFIFSEVATIVRAGNRKLAGYLIKEGLDVGGYGYNKFHLEALTAERAEDLSQFKKMNLMKKTMGERIVTPMHCAAINPNVEILRAFIDLNGEVGVPDEKQRKLVHYAAACEGVGPLKMLVEEKMVDSREADSLKNTTLMIACNFDRVENVNFLLEKENRCNIAAKNKKGYAAIHFAAENGNISILKILLSHNADINFPGPNRMTPLHLAAQNNHMECVEFLIENGAKLNAKDKYKRNSVIIAIKNGNLKIASYLLKKGVAYDDPDSSKNYAIHYAAAYGFYECIELLMKAGADPNVKSSWNLCPLIIALQKSHPRCIRTLLSFPETDVNCKDDTGRTLISQALEHLDDRGFEHLTFLIEEKKADINIKDLKGWSALHYACSLTAEKVSRMRNPFFEKEKEEAKKESLIESEKIILNIIELFCRNGASVNEESNDHLFPLSIALNNNYKIADILLSQNTLDLTKISIADTCVFHDLACLLKYREGRRLFYKIIEILKQKNMKIDHLINLVDNLGFTPLLKIMQVYSLSGKTLLAEKINQNMSQSKDGLGQVTQTFPQNLSLFPLSSNPFPTKVIANKPFFKASFLGTSAFPVRPQIGLNLVPQKNKVEKELTEEEKKEFIKKAYQDYFQENTEFLTFLNDFIELGADPYIQVDRLKKYREDESLLQKEIDEQNEILKKNPKAPKKRITPYGDCGKQGFLHFILRNPSEEILKNFGNLNLNRLINLKDDVEKTPLHFYVDFCAEKNEYDYLYKNNIEILRELLDSPQIQLLTDEADLEGNTPIMNAVFHEKLVFAEQLRNLGKAEINRMNKNGYVPLVKWVKEKHLKNVEKILSLGASPNFEDDKRRNALHYAVNFANFDADASFEMESLLLKHGASINSIDKNGKTPLHYAFVKITSPFENSPIDPVETVSGLLGCQDININIKDKWGKTPLHYAAQRGSNVCGIYLLNSKAEIDSFDEEKNTPLGIAFKNKHQNFVSLLIQNKACINLNFFVSAPEKQKQAQPKNSMFGVGVFGQTNFYNNNNNYVQNNNDSETSSDSSEDESKKKSKSNNNSDDSESDTFSLDEAEQEVNGAPVKNYRPGQLFNYNNFNRNNINTTNDQNLESNKNYSYFNAAIKFGWQGIAYLLIQQGYNLLTAIEAAFQEKKFRLVLTILNKRNDKESFSGVNAKNQNFFHILALFGKEMDEETLIKIFDDLIFKEINAFLKDLKGRTPLHYASHKNFLILVQKLVSLDPSGKSILEEDKFGLNAFSFSLLPEILNYNLLDFFLQNGAKINERIKIKGNLKLTTPLLFAISKGEKNLSKIKWYLERGSSINEKDEEGLSTIIYAIRLNSRKLVDFIISHKDFDALLHIDNNKKTPIHHVVTPLEVGSFENIKILNLLAAKFNVKDKDGLGREPLFYANHQDSGIMANELIRLGAERKVNLIKRSATSIISNVEWVEQYDFEEDAEKYVALQKEEDKNKEKTEEKVEVDKNCEDSANLEVFIENGTPYDVLLIKVDLKNTFFGLNVFYKFQLLYDKNRDLFILFTRWGSIGSSGQFQRSPFGSKDEAIEQFKKLYLSKTGNEWSNIGTFEKKEKKYQLIKMIKKKSLKEILKPFDLKSADLPHFNIPKRIAKVMQIIADVKIYSEGLRNLNIDTEYLPLSSLNKELLIEAKEILIELSELIQKINESTNIFKNANAANILKLRETIALRSSRYFELVPSRNYQDNMILPIDNENSLRQNLGIIESLIDFEVSAKILLSAHFNIKTINPLDYIYNGLGIRMMNLETEDPEYKIIWRYINNSHKIRPKFIKNIFALERRDEAERILKHKHLSNKMLLWHGSNIQNFMGILGQGLRIAPPTSNINGHAFGKGIYLADMFEKSWNYSCNQREKYIFMLLCETALGNMLELNNFEYINKLDAQYDSVYGKGKNGPNFKQNMYLANGCSIPIGKIINYPDEQRYLAQNEYVVYDESQIRLRYLVQINKKYNEK